ncbi:OsmC family protein [Nocardia huaxiensis]|uniref:OsmC family protein n=1 Tax=Nocardia huaxiensis TaxID=2755382 RepID=A0A7D6VAH5_9NOCA|nr:OsmC family protein [Nocardia huaxiensis]QLY28137.1 OsmC family protein [Nocardia huaxiensis]
MTVADIDPDALRATADAVRHDPVKGRFTFRVDGDWYGGFRLRSQVGALTHAGELDTGRAGRFTLAADEPAEVLGTDTAVSPVEYVLQALAGCYTVTLASNAALRGIALHGVHLDLEADLDLAGFLAVDPNARPGIGVIRVAVALDAPDSTDAELDELVEVLQRRSVIRDTLVNPVAVETVWRRG